LIACAKCSGVIILAGNVDLAPSDTVGIIARSACMSTAALDLLGLCGVQLKSPTAFLTDAMAADTQRANVKYIERTADNMKVTTHL
jgi:hypothetical protein